ncbi:MAG: TonB-dependent receptor [Solimonas sp.]
MGKKTEWGVMLALGLAALGQQAQADEDQSAQAADSAQGLDEIVVTGTARTSGLAKLDAGFSITTVTPEDIQRLRPQSTADLMRIVPGVFAETSGGVAGLNVGVRGFPQSGGGGFATVQLDGAPEFVPATLDFLEGFSLFRIDDTVERVEVLRGGPSPIFSNGNPGLTVNFIQKKGQDVPEGSLALTGGDEGLYRLDGYYGGKLADGVYGSVGGFWRTSDGIRDTQFPADEGGQLSATLSRRWGEHNDFTVYARKTKDSNAFFAPEPVVSHANGKISAYPGFDQRKDTLLGNDTRLLDFEVTSGTDPGRVTADLSDGRTIDLNVFGSSLDLEAGDWRLSNRQSYLSGTANVRALFSSATPTTLASYISAQVTAANADSTVLAAAGSSATTGTATFTGSGATITDTSLPVIVALPRVVDKDIQSFSDEIRLSRTFGDHAVTFGLYLASYEVKDQWYYSSLLLAMEPNARRIDLALDNGVQITRDGFTKATIDQVKASYSGRNVAGFVADEWQISDALRIDGGVRLEHYQAEGSDGTTTSGVDLDDDALTYYDNSTVVLDGGSTATDFSATMTSWTLGANYDFRSDLSGFARINSGHRPPSLGDVRSQADGSRVVTQNVDQYELGLKNIRRAYDVAATLFFNDFDGQTYTQDYVDPDTSEESTRTAIAGSRTYGLELEGGVRPLRGLEVRFDGTWLHGRFRDIVDGASSGVQNGNKILRQPSTQYRIVPSYQFSLANADLTVFGTYSYVGRRFSDIANLQPLPSYETVDLGATLDIGNFSVQLVGTNVTNELALTEGNPRVSGSGNVDNVVLGRAIFGREYQLSLRYRF